MRVKSNEEVFEMIQIHEILSKLDCSEIEENKAEFVTIIMNLFEIYNKDGDGNCLFRASVDYPMEHQIIIKESKKLCVNILLQNIIYFLI